MIGCFTANSTECKFHLPFKNSDISILEMSYLVITFLPWVPDSLKKNDIILESLIPMVSNSAVQQGRAKYSIKRSDFFLDIQSKNSALRMFGFELLKLLSEKCLYLNGFIDCFSVTGTALRDITGRKFSRSFLVFLYLHYKFFYPGTDKI